jgi:hypothetical protein
MAPHLAHPQRTQLHDMIRSNSLHDKDIADIVGCSSRTAARVRTNIRTFGVPCAPKQAGGRHSGMLPHVLSALMDYLTTTLELHLDEMAGSVTVLCNTRNGT